MDSLSVSEELGGRGATHPRVSLDDINVAIAGEYYMNAGKACAALNMLETPSLGLMTLCFLTLTNGFVVVGKSAPASPENFNHDKGKIFAREDAIRQLWPLMGYSLRDKLASEAL